MEERLQKIIARAGLASRRRAEEMIASGLVTVNGKIVTEMGTRADAAKDHIKVSGKLLQFESGKVYVLLNKPPEVVSTMSDPEGRQSLRDLLHGIPGRVFPVGRLEYHSSGLILLTSDGDLANRILKSHHLPQTYQMKLKTLLTFEEIENLSRATGARISRIRGKDAPWYIVTMSDSRRDALRDKLFQTGHPVEKIKRVAIGSLDIGPLGPGHHRMLSSAEVASLVRSFDGTAPIARPADSKNFPHKSVGHMADGHGAPKRRNFVRKPFVKKSFEDEDIPMEKPRPPKSFERAPFGRSPSANEPFERETPTGDFSARKFPPRAPGAGDSASRGFSAHKFPGDRSGGPKVPGRGFSGGNAPGNKFLPRKSGRGNPLERSFTPGKFPKSGSPDRMFPARKFTGGDSSPRQFPAGNSPAGKFPPRIFPSGKPFGKKFTTGGKPFGNPPRSSSHGSPQRPDQRSGQYRGKRSGQGSQHHPPQRSPHGSPRNPQQRFPRNSTRNWSPSRPPNRHDSSPD